VLLDGEQKGDGIVRRFSYIVLLAVVGALVVGCLAATPPPDSAPPPEIVVLEVVGGASGGCGPASLDFVRVLPDGSSSPGFFRVPEGRLLVVTDADWQYAHATRANKMEILRLFIENLADPSQDRRAFESTILLNADGEGGISEHMTTGLVVSSQARICPDLFPGPLGPPSGLQHLIIRGYMVPES